MIAKKMQTLRPSCDCITGLVVISTHAFCCYCKKPYMLGHTDLFVVEPVTLPDSSTSLIKLNYASPNEPPIS